MRNAHPFVHPPPQDGQHEEGTDGSAQVTLDRLDVVEQLSPLRRLHQRDPENSHHAQQQHKDPARRVDTVSTSQRSLETELFPHRPLRRHSHPPVQWWPLLTARRHMSHHPVAGHHWPRHPASDMSTRTVFSSRVMAPMTSPRQPAHA